MTATRSETAARTNELPLIPPKRDVRGACPMDCPDTCSWVVTVEDGRAVGLKRDRAHPHTRGAWCVKLKRYLEHSRAPGNAVEIPRGLREPTEIPRREGSLEHRDRRVGLVRQIVGAPERGVEADRAVGRWPVRERVAEPELAERSGRIGT